MKTQVIVIHGGHALEKGEDFIERLKNRNFTIKYLKPPTKWTDTLEKDLGNKFEVFTPKMPNKENARYEEWKIWFERFVPFIHDGVILVGHSLGGLFLIKYLSENIYPKKIKAVFAVAAPYFGKGRRHERNNNYRLGNNLNKIFKQVETLTFFHSKDDPMVPVGDFERYKKNMSEATFRLLHGRAHFNGPSFLELVSDVKALV